jgi:hypothetical protein
MILDDRGEPLCLMASFIDTTQNRLTGKNGAVQNEKKSDE